MSDHMSSLQALNQRAGSNDNDTGTSSFAATTAAVPGAAATASAVKTATAAKEVSEEVSSAPGDCQQPSLRNHQLQLLNIFAVPVAICFNCGRSEAAPAKHTSSHCIRCNCIAAA